MEHPELSPEDELLVAELVDDDMPDPHMSYRFQRAGTLLVAYHRTEKEETVLCHDGEGWGYRDADDLPRMEDPGAPLRHWWRLVRLMVWKHKQDVPPDPRPSDKEAYMSGVSAYEHAKACAKVEKLGPVGNKAPPENTMRVAASKGS